MKKVLFTEEELNALVTMIDVAVKQQGLQLAEAGIFLVKKLQNAEEVEAYTDS